MKTIKKIPKVYIIYFIVLLLIISFPFIVLWKKTRDDYNETKEEAIKFIKDNRSEIIKQVNNVLETKPNTCNKWGYYELCYQNDAVHIKEVTGLFVAKWQLLYSNNKWYYCYKTCDKREVLEDL